VDSFTNIPVSIGLGIYAPYGLAVNWGDAAPFKTVAESGKLLYATVNPDIAWQLSKTLSVAGGPTINYSEATFQSALPAPFPFGEFKFHGEDIEPGFTLGALWHPFPMWAFGLNYHSATTMNYSGKVQQTFGAPYASVVYTTAKIHFPQTIVEGISFRPTPKWNLEFDLNWTQWSTINHITFQNTPFGPTTLTLNYRDSFVYDFGVTRDLGKGYYASVGYIYSENSDPAAHYTPLDPDADLSLGNFGIGHHGKTWDWGLAYQFAFNCGRTINSDANTTADGTYKTFNNAWNASVTYKF
jgi:long-chain fatty acid transport protein